MGYYDRFNKGGKKPKHQRSEKQKWVDKLRDAAFKGVQQCLRTFMKGYPDDGGCEEGVR